MIILGPREAEEVDRMLDLLKDEPVALRLVPDVQRYVTLGCDVENFDGLPIVRLNDSPLLGGAALLKRTTDLCVAALALMILAPLMGLLALAVKLTSRGPVFYGQERCGLDGRSFTMYKFRSMRTDAEQKTGAVWATKGDDRRTPIGAFLRKTSLDELPQFWNVLRGEMSLVGPRAERPELVADYQKQVPFYRARLLVKPGLTGWAQINYGYVASVTETAVKIEYDLYYIKHRTFGMDFQIILRTIGTVLRRTGR
jgi:exopolysaccharide biosynthesis polyprenyl glycosylphosphotransferase